MKQTDKWNGVTALTDRVKRLKDRLRISKYPLCIEKFRIANETLEQTDGLPQILRRAQIHANILDRIPIFIEEDDLIAGAGASKPFGLEIDYEYGIWTPDEVEALKSEVYTIDPEDEAELYRLNERFGGNSLNSNLVKAMGEILGEDERLWPFMKSSVVLPPWKDKTGGSGGGFAQSGMGLGPGFFLVVPGYERVLNEGAQSIIDECRDNLRNLRYFAGDSIEKKHYWEAVIKVHEAWIRFANRYADLAEEMAAASDAERAEELKEIARICRKVPQYPAESFREAVQSFC
jgi:formate C-acetyltransferase